MIYKCKMCGASLEIEEGMNVCKCDYCETRQTLPKADNEQNLNMYNRANHFRQQCEFDKAAELYEKMAMHIDDDSELFWSIVLCRYGIEYVDDPRTKKKIATCHRTQFRSIFEDPDYKTAISLADEQQKEVYESEAAYIDSIQKGILEISNREEPFDVFICYKENDENGRRTPDSVLAQELYYGLTREGYKVFFSRITLESKLGTEYEPYIFAALNSAKVMVVVGTKAEYFNSVWVRNEWSRYLMLMQEDRSRVMIPAYKNMDPYDLPDALSMFQAQDMSKLGFMQDLIRGIQKISAGVGSRKGEEDKRTASSANKNVENLLKRGKLALEDGDFDAADGFFENVLNVDVEEARAHIGKLMVEYKIKDGGELLEGKYNVFGSGNYKKAERFAKGDVKDLLEKYKKAYDERVDGLKARKNDKEADVRRLKAETGELREQIRNYSVQPGETQKYDILINEKNDNKKRADELVGKRSELFNRMQELKKEYNNCGFFKTMRKRQIEAEVEALDAKIAEISSEISGLTVSLDESLDELTKERNEFIEKKKKEFVNPLNERIDEDYGRLKQLYRELKDIGEELAALGEDGEYSEIFVDEDTMKICRFMVEQTKLKEGVDLSQDRLAMKRIIEASVSALGEIQTSGRSQIFLPYISATGKGPVHIECELDLDQLEKILNTD